MRAKVMNLPGSSNAFWFFVRFLVRRIGVSSCFGTIVWACAWARASAGAREEKRCLSLCLSVIEVV